MEADASIAVKLRATYPISVRNAIQLAHALRVLGDVRVTADPASIAQKARELLSSAFSVEVVTFSDFSVRADAFRNRWERVFAVWSAAAPLQLSIKPGDKIPFDPVEMGNSSPCVEMICFNEETWNVTRPADALRHMLYAATPRSYGNDVIRSVMRVMWTPAGTDCDVLEIDALQLKLYSEADAEAAWDAFRTGRVGGASRSSRSVVELEGGKMKRKSSKRASRKKSKSKSRKTRSRSKRATRPSRYLHHPLHPLHALSPGAAVQIAQK